MASRSTMHFDDFARPGRVDQVHRSICGGGLCPFGCVQVAASRSKLRAMQGKA